MLLKIKKPKIYKMRAYNFILIVFLVYFIAPSGASHLKVLNNSCVDCHEIISPFTAEQSRLNEIRLNHTEKNISCSLECHEDVIRKMATNNFKQWSDSSHSKYYVTCDSCHGGNPNERTEAMAHDSMKDPTDATSPIYFKNVPETCGKCHAEELDHFKNTMHYQRLRSTSRAPSCITCHQPHSFKVLKASELTTVCSICHNLKDEVAIASVPKDAKMALEKADEFKEEILRAKISLAEAKAAGKDVTSAQLDLDKANSIMEDIPSLWHGFNLKDFDSQVQTGIDLARKSEGKTSSVEPTVPRVPAIGLVLVFGILAFAYALRKR